MLCELDPEPMTFWPLLLLGAAAMAAMMLVVWLVSVRIRNAGIVDIAWAAGFSVLAVLDATLGGGHAPRRWLMATMVAAWSLRLAIHLYTRAMGSHPVEDGRYQQLRREWGAQANARFFWFFQLQGFLDTILSTPLLLACLDPRPGIRAMEWAAFALWCAALAGETTADRQLRGFKTDPRNRGGVCQVGLWRYSRHPNYFFEWLVWCAYFLFVCGSPHGWITVYCPLLMLYFLFRVTGIPATEQQALRSRADAYREYQRTTSAFFPWSRRA